jgi:hypothetical protein
MGKGKIYISVIITVSFLKSNITPPKEDYYHLKFDEGATVMSKKSNIYVLCSTVLGVAKTKWDVYIY